MTIAEPDRRSHPFPRSSTAISGMLGGIHPRRPQVVRQGGGGPQGGSSLPLGSSAAVRKGASLVTVQEYLRANLPPGWENKLCSSGKAFFEDRKNLPPQRAVRPSSLQHPPRPAHPYPGPVDLRGSRQGGHVRCPKSSPKSALDLEHHPNLGGRVPFGPGTCSTPCRPSIKLS